MVTQTYAAHLPFPSNSVNFDAIDLRRTVVAGMLAHTSSAVQGLSGLLSGGIPSFSSGNVVIPEGVYAVNGATPQNGTYLVHTSPFVVAPVAADSGNDRIDVVYLQVIDTYVDGGSTSSGTIVYLTGTASSTPVAPTIPANALQICKLTVPRSGNGSPSASGFVGWTSLGSAVYPCTSTSRPAFTKPGSLIFETDTLSMMMWNGTSWVRASFRDRMSVVTSTTRPQSPQAGDLILETDTSRTYVWTGSAWNSVGGGVSMVTSTTRPQSPRAGDAILETDTGIMSVWDGGKWSHISGTAMVVSSTTRPSSPVKGDLIYETDTTNVYIHDGNSFVRFTPDVTVGKKSDSKPSSPAKGDMFMETDAGHLNVYNGSFWTSVNQVSGVGNKANRPANPNSGDLYYETDTGHSAIYNGSSWIYTSSESTVGTKANRPANPALGDLYYETDTDRIAMHNGSAWVYVTDATGVGPASSRPSAPSVGDMYYETDTSLLKACATAGSWITISNNTDSGWQSLTIDPKWTAVSGYTPQYRLNGNRVTVRGMVQAASGTSSSANIGTLPAGFRPTTNTPIGGMVSASGAFTGMLFVSSAGGLWFPYMSGTFATGVAINIGCTFLID